MPLFELEIVNTPESAFSADSSGCYACLNHQRWDRPDLEIKNVRRVADDIQKRLYEIAEASLEMKFLYGTLRLEGLALQSTKEVLSAPEEIRKRLRDQITQALPVVVVLMLCSSAEAERYRPGAQAFVDRVFFQEEIEDCLAFLRDTIARHRDITSTT